MIWKVEYTKEALKDFDKLDRNIQKIVVKATNIKYDKINN